MPSHKLYKTAHLGRTPVLTLKSDYLSNRPRLPPVDHSRIRGTVLDSAGISADMPPAFEDFWNVHRKCSCKQQPSPSWSRQCRGAIRVCGSLLSPFLTAQSFPPDKGGPITIHRLTVIISADEQELLNAGTNERRLSGSVKIRPAYSSRRRPESLMGKSGLIEQSLESRDLQPLWRPQRDSTICVNVTRLPGST